MAMKIPVDGLIGWFERMYREKWRYTWGSAEDHNVDCSGALCYAYRQYGRSIYHGSNTIARKHIIKLLPISEARPGMAAFKIREPGHPKYDLPAKFRKGGAEYNGDLNDYYHVGVVDRDGKHVLNAQSTSAGFTRTKLSTWGAVGYLSAVDYSGDAPKEGSQMQTMKVTSTNGGAVRMRKSPSTDAEPLAKLPVGTVVEAGEDVNGWREIVYRDDGGYMMSQFLAPVTEEADPPQGFVLTLSTEQHKALCEMRDRMEADLKLLKSIVGVG